MTQRIDTLKRENRKIFLTVAFNGIPHLFDYPRDIPLPRIGELIQLNGHFGRVENIKHHTRGNITEISISCKQL